MQNSRRAEAITLDTRQGRLAGLRWRAQGAPKVICLHGWLDNAASFVPLAPYLGRLDLLAIDLPGHGHSEHRHSTSRYHFMDYLFNLDAALETLEWNDCHLLGHSMGAAISTAYAAGAPERVRSIVLLDTLGPVSADPAKTTERLRRSLFKNRRGTGQVRQFDTLDQMIRARGLRSGISPDAARLICERGARRVGSKYEWRSDPALNWISSLVMTDEQALDLISHVSAPALTFIATPDSPWSSEAKTRRRQRALAKGTHVSIQGSHHFHMDVPEKIAETIQQFIVDNDNPASPGAP